MKKILVVLILVVGGCTKKPKVVEVPVADKPADSPASASVSEGTEITGPEILFSGGPFKDSVNQKIFRRTSKSELVPVTLVGLEDAENVTFKQNCGAYGNYESIVILDKKKVFDWYAFDGAADIKSWPVEVRCSVEVNVRQGSNSLFTKTFESIYGFDEIGPINVHYAKLIEDTYTSSDIREIIFETFTVGHTDPYINNFRFVPKNAIVIQRIKHYNVSGTEHSCLFGADPETFKVDSVYVISDSRPPYLKPANEAFNFDLIPGEVIKIVVRGVLDMRGTSPGSDYPTIKVPGYNPAPEFSHIIIGPGGVPISVPVFQPPVPVVGPWGFSLSNFGERSKLFKSLDNNPVSENRANSIEVSPIELDPAQLSMITPMGRNYQACERN